MDMYISKILKKIEQGAIFFIFLEIYISIHQTPDVISIGPKKLMLHFSKFHTMYLFVDATYKGNLDWGIYVSVISNKLEQFQGHKDRYQTYFFPI